MIWRMYFVAVVESVASKSAPFQKPKGCGTRKFDGVGLRGVEGCATRRVQFCAMV
jgi:hypothetical protein